MESDAELVKAAKRGDEFALETLLRRYETRIYSYLCRMLGNTHDAADAAQEALMKAIHGLRRYRERGYFRSWIFRIAHRQGLKTIRRRGRSAVSLDDNPGLDPLAPGSDPREDLSAGETLRAVDRALQALPEAERQVVSLHLESGLPFKEIAKVMGCPLNTALGRMHNARKRLRASLERELAT